MIVTNLLYVVVHLEGSVELLVAVLTLRQIAQIGVLLLVAIDVTLHVRHDSNVVVQHFVAIPTLQIYVIIG